MSLFHRSQAEIHKLLGKAVIRLSRSGEPFFCQSRKDEIREMTAISVSPQAFRIKQAIGQQLKQSKATSDDDA
jgi:hypothetical protein